MSRFNYRTSTFDDLVLHIVNNTHQAVQAAKTYYQERGEEDAVRRIDKARIAAKMHKLKQQLEQDDENHTADT